MSEAEKIAASLTKAQRQVIISTDDGGVRDFSEVSGMVRVNLFRKGLLRHSADTRTLSFLLTDLGLAVREVLQRGEVA